MPKLGGTLGDAARVAWIEARLRVLSECAPAFSASSTTSTRLFDAIAECVATELDARGTLLLLSSDRGSLEASAQFARDTDALRLARAALAEPIVLATHPLLARIVESGEPFLAAGPDLAPLPSLPISPGDEAFVRAIAGHGAIIVPLRAAKAPLGVIVASRVDASRLPFGEGDVSVLTSIAEHASLAIVNALAFRAQCVAPRDVPSPAAEKSRISVDEIPAPIYVFDIDTLDVLEANAAALDLYGYTRSELLGLKMSDLRSAEDAPSMSAIARAMGDVDFSGSGRHRRKDGSLIFIHGRSHLGTFGGRPARFVVLNMLGGFFETAPDAVVVVDRAGTIALANRTIESVLGYTRQELAGQPVDRLLPERYRGKHLLDGAGDADARGDAGLGRSRELIGLRRDGTELPIDVTLMPVRTHDELLVATTIRDITERKSTETVRDRLAAVVEASADAIIGKDLKGTITSWNRGAARIFGYSADEMVGQSIFKMVPEGLEEEEHRILERLTRGEIVEGFETVRRRKDGSDVHVLVTSAPIRDTLGTVIGASKVAHDITRRKQAEDSLASAIGATESANRELESFSYSVAHDLRAPLRAMNGFAQLLTDEYKHQLDADGQDWLNEIQLNASRMAELIDALLALARLSRSALRRESVDLSMLVRNEVNARAAAEHSRQVELRIEEGVRADADPILARAVVENLVANAWKFTSKIARARIEFGRDQKEGDPGFYLRDNGAGFDMAFAKMLFAPFQRLHTSNEFPGTGVGLATVQRIINRHGGRLSAEGIVDGGATFRFSFSGRGTSPVTQNRDHG